MNFLLLSRLICFVLFFSLTFGSVNSNNKDHDLSLLLSNGMKLGSFRDSLRQIESQGHKISSLACTSGCDDSCNEDCDSCNDGCDGDCDSDCDSGCDFLWWSCDNGCDSDCDSDCDDSCDSESCDSGCTEGCDETCGDDDAETEWLAYMDEYGDHIADRIISTTTYCESAYSCYQSSNISDCTDEYVAVYENSLEDVVDNLDIIFVDDSYNTALSFSVGWIDEDDSKTVFVGVLHTDNETLLFMSESNKILTISNNNSYFGSIGFWWSSSDLTETNYFESQNVNISGCDWSMDLSLIYNQDTFDWEGMAYSFSYNSDDDTDFSKQELNLTNVYTKTIDISDYLSNSSSSSSRSRSSKVDKFAFKSESFSNEELEWSWSDMMNNNNNNNINTVYMMLIIALVVYIITLQMKMKGSKISKDITYGSTDNNTEYQGLLFTNRV